MRLLVTRPESDAQRTAAKLRALGCDVLLAPMLRIETAGDAGLGAGPWAAVALTSANAVAFLEAHPRRAELLALPAYVVGQRTADAARAAGFGRITSADGDETDLVRLIGTRCAGALVLYLAGEERARDLAADLKSFGIAVETVVAYRALAVSKLPEAICEALAAGNIDGVLHFSRRSAEAYIRCAQNAAILQQALAPAHYALSQQVVEPLALAGADTIFIADRPDEAALINLIAASPG